MQLRQDGWSNYFTGHGIVGADKRMGAAFMTDVLSFDQMQQLARGDDLAKRAGETLPKEAFRQGWDLVIAEEEDDEDEGERVQEILDKLDVLGAKSYMKQALCYERFYGGAAILLGVNDGQKDLTQPLNFDKVRSIDWLTPLEARELMPVYGYADPRAPKYGQPEIYRLVTRAVLPSHDGKYYPVTVDIHESRLLVFPGNRVSRYQTTSMQGGWGDSILTPMYRVLRDFNMTWASAGALVADFAQAVYKFDNLWETLSGDEGEAFQLRLKMMELTRSTINATVIDAKDDFIRQSTPITGLPDLLDKFAVRLAAAADMPLTLLFGTSPAGMNATGESDIRFFYDRVAEYQEERVLPQLKKLIQIVMRVTGVKAEPKKWSVRFRPLWQESAKDKATAMLTQAQADVAWIGAGVFSAEECSNAHWASGEYNPDITIDFDAREKQEQVVKAPINQKDLNALNPDHPDYKATSLDPDNNNYVKPPVDPNAPPPFGKKPPFGGKKGKKTKDALDEAPHYALARAWRKKFRPKAADDGADDYVQPPEDPDEPDPNTPPQNPIKTADEVDNVVTPESIRKEKHPSQLSHNKSGTSTLNGKSVERGTPESGVPLGRRHDYSPDQERDESGKWTSGGAEGLAKSAQENGGFTYNPHTGEQPKAGYSVAIHGDREKKIPGGSALTPDVIKNYIKDNHDVLLRDPGAHIGAWFNQEDKTWYLDVPHVEKSLDTAVKLGQDNKQLGIYDLGRGETIHDKEYGQALARTGRFNKHDSASFGRSASGLRSTYDDAGGDGRSDEGAREESSRAVNFDYDPNQPRDEHGRFGESGTGDRIARVVAANGPWKTEKESPPSHVKAAVAERKAKGIANRVAGKKAAKAQREAEAKALKERIAAHQVNLRGARERVAAEKAAAEASAVRRQNDPGSLDPKIHAERLQKMKENAEREQVLSNERLGLDPRSVLTGERLRAVEPPGTPVGGLVGQHNLGHEILDPRQADPGKAAHALEVAKIAEQVREHENSALANEPSVRPGEPGPSVKLNGNTPQNPTAERKANDEGRADLAFRQIAAVKPNEDRGANGSYRVTLDDGSKALWKPVSGESGDLRYGIEKGTYYLREAAFSRVAQNLGVADLAPASVVHEHEDSNGKTDGALQSWITGTPARYSGATVDRESAERMRVADYVTGNTDRHAGNMLIHNDKAVLIDHGLTFSSKSSDRFIQPWNNIPHDKGPLLSSTVDQISKINPSEMAKTLRGTGIEKNATRYAVMRALHVQAHPEILEVPTRAPRVVARQGSSYMWDDLPKTKELESEHGAKADAIMKDIK